MDGSKFNQSEARLKCKHQLIHWWHPLLSHGRGTIKQKSSYFSDELHAMTAAVQQRQQNNISKIWRCNCKNPKFCVRGGCQRSQPRQSCISWLRRSRKKFSNLCIVYFVYIVTFVYLTSTQKENQSWNMINCNIGIKQTVPGRHY